jgi:molecular chaperone DnaJ
VYDYYKILDISRTASQEDIKKAYRQKAKLVHPDVNSSPKAAEVFAVVNEAYEVLLDDRKRYLHDLKLNYADAKKEDAERKRQYYGSSSRNDSYTNQFHYDWESTARAAQREKTDEDYYKESPLLYNLFFVSGMLIGFVILAVAVTGTIEHYWPLPFGLIGLTGIILVREGWRGMLGKNNIMNKLIRRIRK